MAREIEQNFCHFFLCSIFLLLLLFGSQSNEINNIQFVGMPSIVTCQLASIPACAHTNTATRVQCEVCLSHEPSVPVSIDRFVWFNRQILETENGQLLVHIESSFGAYAIVVIDAVCDCFAAWVRCVIYCLSVGYDGHTVRRYWLRLL